MVISQEALDDSSEKRKERKLMFALYRRLVVLRWSKLSSLYRAVDRAARSGLTRDHERVRRVALNLRPDDRQAFDRMNRELRSDMKTELDDVEGVERAFERARAAMFDEERRF